MSPDLQLALAIAGVVGLVVAVTAALCCFAVVRCVASKEVDPDE